MTDAALPRAFIIGHPIAQSRSPMLHGYWLKTLGLPGSYSAYDVPPAELDDFFAQFQARGLTGGNVTVPHKTAAMAHMSRIDEAGQAIGAINTIWTENGKLVGGNTDCAGFLGNLDERAPGWDKGGKTALVLGAGGASRAVCFGLLQRGFTVHLANRTRANADALARHLGARVVALDWADLGKGLAEADLVVNTTSLGMMGKDPLTLDLGALKAGAVVNDIVYVPLETQILKDAKARGHRTVDGLGMLLHQAVEGFVRWFGVRPTVTADLRAMIEADIRAKTPGA